MTAQEIRDLPPVTVAVDWKPLLDRMKADRQSLCAR